MVLNLCVHMPCFELTKFFRRFANDLKNIEFEDAELIKTSANKQFISFKSIMPNTTDVSNIHGCQLRESEIVKRIKIRNDDFKNWHYDRESTKNATQFAILTKNATAVLKSLCQSLEIDILAEIQTVELQDNSDLLILNKTTIYDFEIVLRSLNEIDLKSYYFHNTHRTFYPLFLSCKSNHSATAKNVRNFPNTASELVSNSFKHIFSDFHLESKYLRNHSNNLKIDKTYTLSKSFERNESNQLSTIIECKRNDLTQVFNILTKLLEFNDKVLVYEYNNNIHIVLLNVKINLLNGQVYKLIKQKYLTQNDVKVFPIEIRDDNSQSFSKNALRVLLPADNNNFFRGFLIHEISEENARAINYFSHYNSNFKYTMHDSISINVFGSNKINYSNMISFDEYIPSDDSKVDTTLQNISLKDDDITVRTENIDLTSSVNTMFTSFVHEDETIRNEVKSLGFQEIQSKKQDIYDKLQSINFDVSQSADFKHLWEEIVDLVLTNLDIKITDIHTRSEILINLTTQLSWYDLADLINSSISDKINSFYQKNITQNDMIIILHKSLLHVLHMKVPVDKARTFDLYKISREHVDYKLRTLYLEILADSNHDSVFISRELEEIVCMLNLSKNENIGKFTLYNLISTVFPDNSNSNNIETNPTEFLSRLSDLHRLFIASEKVELSSNALLSILNLASKFPNTLDFIRTHLTNEDNNEFLFHLKSFIRSINDVEHANQQFSTILHFVANKISDKKECCKILSILLNLLDSKFSNQILSILKDIGVNSINLLSMYSDVWKHVIGDEIFATVIKNSIESLINSETLYLTDYQIRNVITLLDTIVETQNDSNGKESNSYANEKILEIWSKKKISNTQFIHLLNSKYLDLSNLYVKRLINRRLLRTHFAAWKDSSDTGDYQLQIQYAKYLCNISKIDEAFNILTKILDHLAIMVKNKTINTVNYPLHKLISDLVEVLPLTGKFSKVNEILARIEELIQQNNYFGRSIFSVERIEIYVAFINCYASFSMNNEAKSQLITLLEKILPAHHSASNEHLLFVFQKLWKSVINNLPHLTPKIINVFEKIFTNADADNEYLTIFNIYKHFHQFSNSSDKIPIINMLNNNLDDFSFDSEFVLFKTWLEVAEEIKILEKVNVVDFIETAYQQILQTNSGIRGFNELCEFLNKNIEPNKKISKEEERIINREVSEIKERIAQIYSELIK